MTHEFTPDQIEDTITAAIKARDFHVIEGLIGLLALQDADRAQAVLDTIDVGLSIAAKRDAAS